MIFTDGTNVFINSSSLANWGEFVNSLNQGFLTALGSQDRFSLGNLTQSLNLRLEWRPNIVEETLTGTVTLNNQSLPNNQYSTINDGNSSILSNNARFGLYPFNSVSGCYNQVIQSNGSIPIFNQSNSIGGIYGQNFTKFLGVLCKNEVIIVATNDNYTRLALSCQGFYQLGLDDFNIYPQLCFSYQNFYQGYSTSHYDISGFSFWKDFSKIPLLYNYEGDYTTSCYNGESLNSSFPVTDFVSRANYSDFNSPVIGMSTNLKIGVGSGFTIGTKYQITVDSGSNLWLCIGYYNYSNSNKKLLIRVIS